MREARSEGEAVHTTQTQILLFYGDEEISLCKRWLIILCDIALVSIYLAMPQRYSNHNEVFEVMRYSESSTQVVL